MFEIFEIVARTLFAGCAVWWFATDSERWFRAAVLFGLMALLYNA